MLKFILVGIFLFLTSCGNSGLPQTKVEITAKLKKDCKTDYPIYLKNLKPNIDIFALKNVVLNKESKTPFILASDLTIHISPLKLNEKLTGWMSATLVSPLIANSGVVAGIYADLEGDAKTYSGAIKETLDGGEYETHWTVPGSDRRFGSVCVYAKIKNNAIVSMGFYLPVWKVIPNGTIRPDIETTGEHEFLCLKSAELK